MYLFDYIFFRISKIYLKTGIETTSPELGGGAVVSLFQGFNIVTIIYFLFSIKMTPYLWVFIWLPLIVINWIIFFNVKNLKKYQIKWDGEEKGKRQIKGVLIIGYMVTSIFFFGLALSKMY
jgi:hypothetical protein